MQDEFESLIPAFRRGEGRAFSEIYRRYHAPILDYVAQRIADREAARDVVQEIFLKTYRFRAAYDPRYAFSTWLWTIARNTVSDFFRRRSLDEPAEARSSESESPEERVPSPHPDAELLYERKSRRKMLRKALMKLTGLQRRVIWMRVIHQLSYQEISRRLGLSLSAVKCLAYRSKLVLRQLGGSPALA